MDEWRRERNGQWKEGQQKEVDEGGTQVSRRCPLRIEDQADHAGGDSSSVSQCRKLIGVMAADSAGENGAWKDGGWVMAARSCSRALPPTFTADLTFNSRLTASPMPLRWQRRGRNTTRMHCPHALPAADDDLEASVADGHLLSDGEAQAGCPLRGADDPAENAEDLVALGLRNARPVVHCLADTSTLPQRNAITRPPAGV